jgi:4-amino-4-deoxy-L-arabinose transferase-like glycosyltransferase
MFARITNSANVRAVARAAVLALPAGYALVEGTVQAYVSRHLSLDRDVLDFQSLAHNMTPYSVFGGVREPLWPVLFVLPVRLLGDHSAIAIRLIGVLGFVFMIVAFQLLARELFGRTLSIIAALVLAASPWLIYQAARGLREETSAGLTLLLCLWLIKPELTGRRIVLLFGLAGLTGLLRWDTMVIMLPVLAIALILRRPHPAAWVAGPAVLMLLVGPLLLGNYIRNGDPLFHSNIHARFFRNIEFHDRPGFPTSAQIAADSFVGPPITWTQYVFGLHSGRELLLRAVRSVDGIPVRVVNLALFYPNPPASGFKEMLLRAPPALLPYLIWILGIAGGIALLRTRAWPVPLILAGTVLGYSPIAGLVDFRLALTVLPLLALCAIEGIRITETFWGPPIRGIVVALGEERLQAALGAPTTGQSSS